MIEVIYNLGIFLYKVLILLSAPFNRKARLFAKGRKGWRRHLARAMEPGGNYVWFHCASLGEFEQGRPVMEELRRLSPEYKILLTFFSPSGFEVRKNYAGAQLVCYLPLDTRRNVKSFYEIVKPVKAIFIKYEFWYHYLTVAKKRGIPVYIISAIFRPGQFFFRTGPFAKWYRKALAGVRHFFVQNAESEKLLSEIGLSNVTISGDTRFDRVASLAVNAKEIPLIEKFKSGSPLVVTGSSWPHDEELVIRFINQSDGIKFIIAPHEVSGPNLKRIKESLKKPFVLYSELGGSDAASLDVVIIDSVGLLSSLYRYGEVAYIGGGFGAGIHNILEAATFGRPVIFGPNYKKFKEANELRAIGGAFPVSNYEELERNLSNLLENSVKLHELSALIKNYVERNGGATKIILNRVFGI